MRPIACLMFALLTTARAKPLIVRDITTAFPDDQLECSDFPDSYGAVPTFWLSKNGWTGIQGGTSGDECVPGSFCSYACPAGYQKSQWSAQNNPATGLPYGGLFCNASGRLERSNRKYSTLCIEGTMAVSVSVNNRGSFGAALCRTDVPGSEEPIIPLWSAAGSAVPLVVPDPSYPTAAFYFLNPKNVEVEDACIFGDKSKPQGYFAPVIIAADYSTDTAFISTRVNPAYIGANLPSSALGYAVDISGPNGTCKFANGALSCSGRMCPNGATGTPVCMITLPRGGNVQVILS